MTKVKPGNSIPHSVHMHDPSKWPVPRLLSTAARLVEYKWNEDLGSLNLTYAGAIILEVLAAEGDLSQVQLAERVRVRAQTVGTTVTRLEANGHIVRTRGGDRRRQDVAITEQGLVALEQAARLEKDSVIGDNDQLTALRDQLIDMIRVLGNDRVGAAGSSKYRKSGASPRPMPAC